MLNGYKIGAAVGVEIDRDERDGIQRRDLRFGKVPRSFVAEDRPGYGDVVINDGERG